MSGSPAPATWSREAGWRCSADGGGALCIPAWPPALFSAAQVAA